MRAGLLRHEIIIQSSTEAAGSSGDPRPRWDEVTPFATVWASVEPLTARETILADGVNSEMTHRIQMRYLAGLTSKHRIKFGARYFDILGVRNIDERGERMELLCREGKSYGS